MEVLNKSKISLIEVQQLRQKWLLAAFISISLILCIGLSVQLLSNQPLIQDPDLQSSALLFVVFWLALWLLILSVKLEIKYDNLGIQFRYFPFILKKKTIEWSEIESIEIGNYSPIREFGGWGIRYGFGIKGRAFTISGNKGIRIIKKNGKRLLFGTHKSLELAEYFRNIGLEFTENGK